MNTINISSKKLEKLSPLDLSKCIFNTEGVVYNYDYRGQEKILKILHNTNGITFASKLYTVEMLDFYKESLPASFICPDNLVSIGGKVSGFTVPKFDGINLADLLNEKSIAAKEKIYFLTKIGEVLNQIKNIRKYGNLQQIFLNDLHESNILVNPVNKELGFIDLDSCKIMNNCAFASRYLGPTHFIEDKHGKYEFNVPENGTGYIIANENSDLYCYNIIILNYLYGNSVTRMSLDEFYEYLNYLESIGLDKNLIDSFNKLTLCGKNINPVNYLHSLSEEHVGRAKQIVYNKARG